MLNTILIIIAILFALPFIMALFVKKDYHIEREVIINMPKHEVFDYLKYIKNQDNYNKWTMLDPDMEKDFRGTDGNVGFIYAWDGNKNAGAGEQEITGITDGERITMELRFIRPFASIGHAYMSTEAESEHSTKVKWGMYGKTSYPRNIMNLVMGGVLGKNIQESLNLLKRILEK
ncbi:SRPBCC family protein [Flavobacterium alkalisoli]|uniref:SRPBCC family protein n=1 Tax=Flavobacterium alkalisoli TaxID=2602769 RepID=A0A5B9FN87_9FLAO|nr:SRPBCC family protein [Flavobacterium alkalisoli]QEE48235.1 SRPBCC family protein [Flavobacterium alkalisoli]